MPAEFSRSAAWLPARSALQLAAVTADRIVRCVVPAEHLLALGGGPVGDALEARARAALERHRGAVEGRLADQIADGEGGGGEVVYAPPWWVPGADPRDGA